MLGAWTSDLQSSDGWSREGEQSEATSSPSPSVCPTVRLSVDAVPCPVVVLYSDCAVLELSYFPRT